MSLVPSHDKQGYQAKILARIRAASLFVPLLSAKVLTPERRFFRLEWGEAVEVSKLAPLTQCYIVPVRIGDVSPDSPLLPEAIRRAQWVNSPGGDFDAAVRRLRELYREYQLAMNGV